LPFECARRCGLREAIVVEVALEAVVEDRVTVILGLCLGSGRQQQGERRDRERERAMKHGREKCTPLVRRCGRNLSARSGSHAWSRSKMEVPNAFAAPITAFANSGERLIAQVIG